MLRLAAAKLFFLLRIKKIGRAMRISMTVADIEFEDIRAHVVGAGILPISFDENEQPYLLLGKERYVSHWRGSLKWSGFEGGRKQGETPELTAAREFVEESLGSVPLLMETQTVEKKENVDRIQMIADALTAGKYIVRIVLCIVHPDVSQRRYHVTYVVRTPYCANTVTRFNVRRQAFVELIAKADQLKRSADALSDILLPRENQLFRGRGVKAVTRVEQTLKMLRIEFVNDLDDTCVCDATDICPESRAAYCHWFQLRMVCMSELQKIESVAHPSAFQEIVRDSFGTLLSLRINDDFVEKQSIDWWAMGKLREVLQNGGCIQNEYFRAYFLPVLQQTLTEIMPV